MPKTEEQLHFEAQLQKMGLDPKKLYSAEQWKQIESGFADQVDVSVFADPKFSADQMDMLHRILIAEYYGFLTRDQVEMLADPEMPAQEMRRAVLELNRNRTH